MMHKLVVVLRGLAESEWMERRWSEDFVPLAERMPGLRRVLVGRARGAPAGPAEVLLLHEFLFDDLASLQAAMAGLALMRFAGERAELFFAEHHEMSLDRLPGAGGTAEGSG
ncbi:MAG: EthD family reductase [Anaerolineales bacterium]|nr:EthD family reductase [Anaerolineales bacterium]